MLRRMPTRTVVAGGRTLVREALRHLLESSGDVEVVATCADRLAVEAAIDSRRPEVVVLHAFLGRPGGGATLTRDLREHAPELGVVLLLGDGRPGEITEVVAQGTQRRALLLLDHPQIVRDLERAVHEVAAGGSVIHPGVIDLMVSTRPASGSELGTLSPRERQVFEGLVAGRSNRSIGEALDMSERAVEKHINQIYAKLDLPVDPARHRRVTAAMRYFAALDGDAGTPTP